MNRKSLKLVVLFIVFIFASCDEPETVVTNIIHPDGSITRKIEMRKKDDKYKITDVQVPLDSTWIISDSLEISLKGDTTWIKRAEKNYKNVDELNLSYITDTGCNSNLRRYASFSHKFRWFNTIYRFSETVGKRLSFGYPLADFLNNEECFWFYSPDDYNQLKLGGPDSLKYKSISDSVDKKQDVWFFRSLVSEWSGEFLKEAGPNSNFKISEEETRKWEKTFMKIIKVHESDFDSLWESGYILREVVGDQLAADYRAEADSALKTVQNRIMEQFSGYSVKAAMPGRLISTNGFADSSKTVRWPVSDDYFLTEDYEMWAESKVPNIWAWVVSALFILFVITGVAIRKNKRG